MYYNAYMPYNTLSITEKTIIEYKGTEAPFSGEYEDHYKEGLYICRKCNNPLFSSKAKFNAGCGWPSFDEYIPGAVKQIPDADGRRTEIVCAHCNSLKGVRDNLTYEEALKLREEQRRSKAASIKDKLERRLKGPFTNNYKPRWTFADRETYLRWRALADESHELNVILNPGPSVRWHRALARAGIKITKAL
jgi:peptide methionine sulfoxide reductase MsrB